MAVKQESKEQHTLHEAAAKMADISIEKYATDEGRGKIGFGLNSSSEIPVIACPNYDKLSKEQRDLVTAVMDEELKQPARSLDINLQSHTMSWKSGKMLEEEQTRELAQETDETKKAQIKGQIQFGQSQQKESQQAFDNNKTEMAERAVIRVNNKRETLAKNIDKLKAPEKSEEPDAPPAQAPAIPLGTPVPDFLKNLKPEAMARVDAIREVHEYNRTRGELGFKINSVTDVKPFGPNFTALSEKDKGEVTRFMDRKYKEHPLDEALLGLELQIAKSADMAKTGKTAQDRAAGTLNLQINEGNFGQIKSGLEEMTQTRVDNEREAQSTADGLKEAKEANAKVDQAAEKAAGVKKAGLSL